MMDFGSAGMLETIEVLDAAGIAHVGAGRNLEEAGAPTVIEQNDHKVGVLACCDVAQDSQLYAKANSAGVAAYDEDRILQTAKNLSNHVDWIVLQVHWGVELAQLPSVLQRERARRLADAGIDLVIGHHPHVWQPIETIDNTLVAYSLGDFLFSSMFWYGTNQREAFLACYRSHALSLETGWIEAKLSHDESPTARFQAAVLKPDLTVRADNSSSRRAKITRLTSSLHSPQYAELARAEEERAAERDRWRFQNESLWRKIALKLLRYRCLPGAYVEPDGLQWLSGFQELARSPNQLTPVAKNSDVF